MLKKLDKKLFFKLYNFTTARNRFAELMALITKYSSRFFSLVYLAGILGLIYNRDPQIRVFILIPALTFIIVKAFPFIYNRSRPFSVFNLKIVIKQRHDHSFPSTHAASSCIIALAILNINLILGIMLLTAAVLTAFSRIMLGVHYPSDILGAWVLALILYFLGINFLI